MPEVIAKFKIYSNDCLFIQKPEAKVFAQVWSEVVKEHLREQTYMADLAKLKFKLTIDHDSIDFTWTGFTESLPNYINDTLTRINQIKSIDTSSMFHQVKENLLSEWKNWYLQ